MLPLENKVVVITGASSGIGEKVAIKAAEKGARPVLLARSAEKLATICESINMKSNSNCVYYQLDVSNTGQVKEVFRKIEQEVGPIDILLNNAGFGIFHLFNEASFTDIEEMFAVNVLGLMACTKEVLPTMLERNTGHIINIASIAGKLATPKSSAYSATKFAVIGFSNSLRMELAKTTIQVSTVNPGPIETNFFNIADQSGNYVKNVKSFMLSADVASDKIVKLMISPKRELNLPWWMNAGSTLYNLFPGLAERVTRGLFDKK